MRENCTSGIAPGAPGNRRSYGGGVGIESDMRIWTVVGLSSILLVAGCAEMARSLQGAISPEFELKQDLAFGGCIPTAGDLIMSSKYSNTEADGVRFEADCKKAAIEKYERKTGKKVVGEPPKNLPFDRRPVFVTGVGFIY